MPGKVSLTREKRTFPIAPDVPNEPASAQEASRFVVHRHAASRLHYDLRLELDGVLKSWALPKGPSLDPVQKRLAVQVEDHALSYIAFEGRIPDDQYGAGDVSVWDSGTWQPDGDPERGLRTGKLKFELHGTRLQGRWNLIRTRMPGKKEGGGEQWLLIKEKDEAARSTRDVDVTAEPPAETNASAMPAAKTAPSAARNAAKASRGAGKRSTANSTSGDAGRSSHAPFAALPEMVMPQLATLVDGVPEQGEWIYELKFDGYRILARVEGGETRLVTRDGKDWTAKLAPIRDAIVALGLKDGWLDGEIVVMDGQGIPSFQLLQNAFDEKRGAQILYFLFDLLHQDGHDLRQLPLMERRARLQALLAGLPQDGPLRFSAPMREAPQQLLDGACRMGMEGIIGKLADSRYRGGRSAEWIKLKCRKRQEFVIAGYTDPQGKRELFGSLLLGVYDDDGRLHYAGRVGTGFDRTRLQTVYRQLQRLGQARAPFAELPAAARRLDAHWVKPTLVAEISFAEWTRGGLVRQAVFHALRQDKPATQIRREQAVAAANVAPREDTAKAAVVKPAVAGPAGRIGRKTSGAKNDAPADVAGVRITHPERIIDSASGRAKIDVARHYEAVAERMLPFLANRPVYLLRAPEGVAGEKFFQKHLGRTPISGVRQLDPAIDPSHPPLLAIDSVEALVSATQMGVIEFHLCGATADRIDRPDCMVFDLDPDPGLPWERMQEAALKARALLDELDLRSFLKTSGGKGLHLVVPLARRHPWKDVTEFSEAVTRRLAQAHPDLFSAKMGAQNRVGRVFVDYLRNQRYASTVAPYSLRARPGLGVATPLAWDELDSLTGAAMWNIDTLPARMASLDHDPWADYFLKKQQLTAVMRRKLGM
ncbi:bifunctional non-homologous end joining protein LigD [Noviherbaspirillum humi]|uniref:DNA ligase (ATP) n=1 Tax=Noviherbaspirillum humi TaxID=1688639 RepID=A0A239L103_9BURK|nr:DNA ligase D [Noviherbaspirillum humi]SNT23598.1 bifunctional non-homologous end joining protein LigD [Noviherbaspirillum humi]